MDDVEVSLEAAGAILTIDLDALQENYRILVAEAAPARCGAVVKADAYGIGAARAVPVLLAAGCRDFFVAQLSEGLALSPIVDTNASITVMNGLQPGSEMLAAEAGLRPVLNSLEQIAAYGDCARSLGRRLAVAVQTDSGMARLGLSLAEVEILAAEPERLDGLDVELVMSHLATADDPSDPFSAHQREKFVAEISAVPALAGAERSLANSGGLFLQGFAMDVARPGVALYGVSPSIGRQNPMRPVVSLEARIVQVRSVPTGTHVGYARSESVRRHSRLATIAVGYADGWLRHLSNCGAAYLGAQRLPIVGRVSMDSTILDVTDLPEGTLQHGSLVELIGPNQPLEAVASDAGTIPYEILTALGHRYHRRYRTAQPEGQTA